MVRYFRVIPDEILTIPYLTNPYFAGIIPYTQIQGKMNTFKSLLDMIDTLSTEDGCREYLEELVWNGQ